MVDSSLPPDPDPRTCPFRKHDVVDLPDTNVTDNAENIRLLKDWRDKCNEYTLNTKNDVPTIGAGGKALVKALKRPTLKALFPLSL